MFRPLTELRTDRGNVAILARLLAEDRSVYAMHTNYDAAPGGMNDVLARRIGLANVRPFGAGSEVGYAKVVVFVPETHARDVLKAMAEAGAGHIGNYDHAAFLGRGTGTFRPLPGADPFVGEVGRLEEVEERRLEMIVPEERLSRVLAAMRRVHPYEEIAYDVYPLREPRREVGLGRIGELGAPVTLAEFAREVGQRLARSSVRVVGPLEQTVRRVAVVGGAGSSWAAAAREAGADVLVTGDVGYHRAREALDAEIALLDVGHDVEAIFVPEVAAYLRRAFAERGWEVEVRESGVTWDPFVTIGCG
ncbi:MAG: Nif3-like dinuclear metal center hexameric protein [Brockia lithotrophica]|nr:Nif3-like dinuclear metal center hexameric protein [Brockia lithotrophica]